MAKAKIYSITWEDDDGEQGYYVELTAFQAKTIKAYLMNAAKKKIIGTPSVDPIEGEWLLSEREFLNEFAERYDWELEHESGGGG